MQSNNQRVKATADSSYSLSEAILAPYRQQLLDSFSTIVATTYDKLVKRKPSGSLGNLVTKAIWEHAKYNSKATSQAPPDLFVLMNYGGIRLQEIAAGPISMGTIYKLLPFENTLVRIDISGTDLVKLLQQINATDGWPIRFNNKKFKSLKDINKKMRYELVTNNYIAQGGDHCEILQKMPQKDSGLLLRDIIIEYLILQKNIEADNTNYILK